jgi:uncharacterized protein (TIGR00645 family)
MPCRPRLRNLAARWLTAVLLVGLAAALALYAVRFVWNLAKLAGELFEPDDSVFLPGVVHLLDAALAVSLIVMVAVSSWDSLVSRLTNDEGTSRFAWAT